MTGDLTGKTLGDYRVDALIGKGSRSHVYRGAHVDLGTPVALKVIDGKFSASPGFKARFFQFAQTVKRVDHHNLVKVYLCGEQDGHAYIVMELVAGGRPTTPRPDVARPWGEAGWALVSVVTQAAAALESAHVRGVTHGSLKVSNLLLTQPELGAAQVKLSNLGLQSLVGDFGLSEGSVALRRYPSNVVEGPGEDVFALAAILYELIAGQPLPGVESGPPSDASLLRNVPAGVPNELTSVLMRCLSSDSTNRIRSCDELATTLAALPRERAAAAAVSAPQPELTVHTPPAVVEAPEKTEWLTAKKKMAPPRPPARAAGDTSRIPCLHVFDEGGNPVEKQYVRTSGLTLGRAAGSDIVLAGQSVSSEHVRLDWDTRRVTVTDLGSRNGTLLHGQRLLPRIAQEWAGEQWLQIGPFWAWLQLPSKDNGLGADKIEISLDAQSRMLTITPGRPATCRLVLVNQKTHVDHVLLEAEGIPEEWIDGIRRDTQLAPFEKRDVTLTINVPRSPAGLARDYHVILRARSAANPDAAQGEAEARWTVLPFEAMSLSISPSRSSGRLQSRYTVTLQHDGNRAATYTLTGTDEDRQLECLFSAEGAVDRNRVPIEVQPGTKANIKLKVAAQKRWFGQPQPYAFHVHAVPSEGQQNLATEAQFTHKSIFPTWMIAAATIIVLGLVMLAPRFLRPDVRTVYIEPIAPEIGERVEVFWDAPAATRIRVYQNELPVRPDPDPAVGKHTFADGFSKDTRIRVVASNIFGEGSREATVVVVPPEPPPPPGRAVIELFQVRPLTVKPDQQVTISWRVRDAERIDLTPLGTVEAEGTVTHSPSENQTYTLTAVNKANEPTTRALQVQVRAGGGQPPRLSLEVSAENSRVDEQGMQVPVGQTVTLTYVAENVVRARIDGFSAVPLEGLMGQRSVALLGEGSYQFKLVGTDDRGQEAESKPVVIRAVCNPSWLRIPTFGIFGRCRETPGIAWK